jgi:DNA-binding transcriptional LysR family regulator
MELRHLITFKTIVDAGGFKKAADQLGYAQSSITGHIKDLEQELGSPLSIV